MDKITNFKPEDLKGVITVAIVAVVALLACWLLTKMNKRVFRRLQKDQKNLHLAFLERFVNIFIIAAVIMLAFSAVEGKNSVVHTLLGGTAVISAVAAFAAQDIIKDLLAGLMISVYKPFDIGDRIELEDGTAGVVEDINMRHIVLVKLDTIREVIPNHRMNAMLLNNYSFKNSQRSVHFRFPIGYDSDVELAKRVIADAIESSEYSVPGRTDENGEAVYSPVYFLSMEASAFMMAVTVYYEKTSPTERVKDDINSRVAKALTENGIEIPYNYVNVVQK